jgi:hypothetical protein
MPAIAGRPATGRTSETDGAPAIAASNHSNNRDASNDTGARSSSNASNSKGDVDRMTATTAGMQTTAEIKATARPPTQ